MATALTAALNIYDNDKVAYAAIVAQNSEMEAGREIALLESAIRAIQDEQAVVANNTTTLKGIAEELRADRDIIKIKEKTTSKVSVGLSLLAGYKTKVDNFVFITEGALSSNFGSVGNNDKLELQNSRPFSITLAQKFGYLFKQNHLGYITLGVGGTVLKSKYDDIVSSNKFTVFGVVGAGYEFMVNKSIGIFTEFNVEIGPKTTVKSKVNDLDLGKVKFTNTQIKVGARYYF